jgi:hypothetical protein
MFIDGNVEKFGQLVEEIMDGKNTGRDVAAAQSVPMLTAAPAFKG